jgi:hypothetical protein
VTHPKTWDEWLSRRTRNVRERIVRFYPHEPDPALMIRGWHPHKRSSNPLTACMSVRRFIERYGTVRYRELKRDDFLRNGRRKSVKLSSVYRFEFER